MKSYDLLNWATPLRVCTRETPTPKGTEVLLKLTHCGVCHTDVHVREGHYDLGDGKKLTFADRGYTLPITPGHEPVGEVAAVGDAVRNIGVGQRYLVNPWIGCGNCVRCEAGDDNLCMHMSAVGFGRWGGFSTHLLIRHPKYLVNIDGIPPDKAAPLSCSGLTTYSAIKKLSPLDPDDWVAVIGCGGLGTMAIAVLRGLGHKNIIACDLDDRKLESARASGALETCNLGQKGPEELTRIAGGPLYAMLDFVGSPATLALAIPTLRKGGRFVVCGLLGGTANIPIPLIAVREIAIQGSIVGNTRDLVALVDLVKQGRIKLPEVERRSFAMVDQSLDDLAAGRIVGRVVVEIDGRE